MIIIVLFWFLRVLKCYLSINKTRNMFLSIGIISAKRDRMHVFQDFKCYNILEV